jgi:acetoin utilization protein AcuB
MLVKDRMTHNPVTATPDTTHRQAVELMRQNDIHHLPIVDKHGRLVGIVVEEDLRAAQPSPATTLSIYEIHSLLSKLPLKQIMRSPVYAVNADCSLEEAARMMIQQHIGCLPVVEQDKVIGIITDTDIFRMFVELLSGGREGARFTLRLANKPGMLAKVAQAVNDAGGNIISANTWGKAGEDEDGYITIKENGADFGQLQQRLDEIGVELVEIQYTPGDPHKQYG